MNEENKDLNLPLLTDRDETAPPTKSENRKKIRVNGKEPVINAPNDALDVLGAASFLSAKQIPKAEAFLSALLSRDDVSVKGPNLYIKNKKIGHLVLLLHTLFGNKSNKAVKEKNLLQGLLAEMKMHGPKKRLKGKKSSKKNAEHDNVQYAERFHEMLNSK